MALLKQAPCIDPIKESFPRAMIVRYVNHSGKMAEDVLGLGYRIEEGNDARTILFRTFNGCSAANLPFVEFKLTKAQAEELVRDLLMLFPDLPDEPVQPATKGCCQG